MSIGIGSTVWVFDGNYRVYPKDRSMGAAPIYREHFRPIEIVAETSRSWVLAHAPWDKKVNVNKKTLAGIFPTKESVDDAVFVHDHRCELADKLRSTHDVRLIRGVMKLMEEFEKDPFHTHIPW